MADSLDLASLSLDQPSTTPPSGPSSKPSKRIVVLISGSGSNLQALIDASHAKPSLLPNAHIAHVLSNRGKAYGLHRAQTSTPPIPTSTFNLPTYLKTHPSNTRQDYDLALAHRVLETKPDMIVLAGFMHILSHTFLTTLGNQIPIINLHPALPSMFDGANAIPRALEAFEKGEVQGTGAMVHRVVEEVDQGEPLIVREVEIKKGDTLAMLEERIHRVEHEIIVEGARKVLEELDEREKETVEGDKVEVKEEKEGKESTTTVEGSETVAKEDKKEEEKKEESK